MPRSPAFFHWAPAEQSFKPSLDDQLYCGGRLTNLEITSQYTETKDLRFNWVRYTFICTFMNIKTGLPFTTKLKGKVNADIEHSQQGLLKLISERAFDERNKNWPLYKFLYSYYGDLRKILLSIKLASAEQPRCHNNIHIDPVTFASTTTSIQSSETMVIENSKENIPFHLGSANTSTTSGPSIIKEQIPDIKVLEVKIYCSYASKSVTAEMLFKILHLNNNLITEEKLHFKSYASNKNLSDSLYEVIVDLAKRGGKRYANKRPLCHLVKRTPELKDIITQIYMPTLEVPQLNWLIWRCTQTDKLMLNSYTPSAVNPVVVSFVGEPDSNANTPVFCSDLCVTLPEFSEEPLIAPSQPITTVSHLQPLSFFEPVNNLSAEELAQRLGAPSEDEELLARLYQQAGI